jgi:hypothetical protein
VSWLARGPGWFRLWGWGVRWVDHRETPPLFSERYGHVRVLHLAGLCFKWLARGGV